MTKYKFLLPLLILFAVEATSQKQISHRRPILDYKSEYDNGDLVAQSSTTTVRWLPPPGKAGSPTYLRNYRDSDQMYQATTTQAVTSSQKAPHKTKKAIKSHAIEMSDALANTETAAEYVSTAIKMWNGPKPSVSPEASKKSQMKYDVFDPKQAAELLHMHQFDPQMYQVPQSMQSMQIPTHYVQPTQYVLEPAYEEQEQMPQQYHPTTLPPQQIITVQPILHTKPREIIEVEPPSTQAPRYARPAIRKPSKPVRQKAVQTQDNEYDLYQNVVTVTKPEPFELPTTRTSVQKEVTAESQRTSVRNPTSTYTVEQAGETHIHHHYAPVHHQHQQYEEETVEIPQEVPHHRPKYVTPRTRTKPTTHTFQVQHHHAVSEESQEHTTPYRTPSPYQQILKATSRPQTHQNHHSNSHLASEVEKELSLQSQSYQIEIPREELIKHIEDSVNKYLKNLNLEEKIQKERPRPSYVPRPQHPQQHVMIVQTTTPPPPPTTTPVPTTPRPVKIPRRRRPVVVQQSQPQAEVSHDHQEQHIIVSNDEYLPPSFVVHQSHPNQAQHQEPIVVTQPSKIYTYEETHEPAPEHYRQPKIIHQEQYQAQYPPNNELARESVVQTVDITDQTKSRPTHIDLSALDVGQSWSHGNTFDHSAALKNLQGFDQSNAVLQPAPQPKLHFNSQTYHDINALPYNPNRDFVSTVEPSVAASAMQPTADSVFFKKQSFGPMPHNTVNMNEGTASVGASISVGGEHNMPGLRDEQVKSITDELGPVHIINGLPVVNPYNIDLHTLKFMLGSPMAPGNVNNPQQAGPAAVSEVPPPASTSQKPRKGLLYSRENGWTNSAKSPATSGSNTVQYKYTGNDLPADSYSPKYNNNPKGDGFQGNSPGSKMHNAHQNGSQFVEVLSKGRVKVVEAKVMRGKRTQVKGREPDTELKPPPRFPKYN